MVVGAVGLAADGEMLPEELVVDDLLASVNELVDVLMLLEGGLVPLPLLLFLLFEQTDVRQVNTRDSAVMLMGPRWLEICLATCASDLLLRITRSLASDRRMILPTVRLVLLVAGGCLPPENGVMVLRTDARTCTNGLNRAVGTVGTVQQGVLRLNRSLTGLVDFCEAKDPASCGRATLGDGIGARALRPGQ